MGEKGAAREAHSGQKALGVPTCGSERCFAICGNPCCGPSVIPAVALLWPCRGPAVALPWSIILVAMPGRDTPAGS